MVVTPSSLLEENAKGAISVVPALIVKPAPITLGASTSVVPSYMASLTTMPEPSNTLSPSDTFEISSLKLSLVSLPQFANAISPNCRALLSKKSTDSSCPHELNAYAPTVKLRPAPAAPKLTV